MPASNRPNTERPDPPVPLIRTKMIPPSLPGDLVARRRLETQLDHSLQVPLTVISAPAGYGKTVLASTWVGALGRQCAWLSLDRGESDLRQFLCYLCEAIEEKIPNGMPATRDLLSSSESAPVEVVAANLVNDLDGITKSLMIILDDYHRLRTDSSVTEMLSIILQHAPSNLHLVILTRRDPPLAMNRLRAGNRLVELRLRDLRFNLEETREFVGVATTARLSDAAIDHLDRELEGWPVGLRLVALMLKRAQDPEAAVAGLRGGIPESQEFMLQEMLAGLSEEFRTSLMKSSILNRFTADTVDAICHGSGPGTQSLGGGVLVDEIRRENLFANSLDPERRWYRFHHWFQHVLQCHLKTRFDAEEVRELHSRAGDWFDANDEPGEAIAHFIEADQPGRAADLIARRYLDEIERDRWSTVDRWLQQLPGEFRRGRVELQLAQAWVGFCKLDFTQVAACIERVVELQETAPGDESAKPQLCFLRGWLLYWSGELEASRRNLEQAIDSFSKNPGMIAGEIRLYYAFALCSGGDYPGAIRFLAEQRVAAGASVGMPYLKRIFGAQCHVAYIAGDIDCAELATDRIRSLDSAVGNQYEQAWFNYFRALQLYNRMELGQALEHFALCENHLNVLERRVAADVLGAIGLAQSLCGNDDAASHAISKLEWFVRDYNPPDCEWLVESVVASRALHLRNTQRALQWAENTVLPEVSSLEMHMWVINPEVTQARVLVAAGNRQHVERGLSQLEGLSSRYRAYHNQCQLFDVEIMRAVAMMRLGKKASAQETLLSVIGAAVKGGWTRPFVEADDTMESMLSQVEATDENAVFLQHLLDTIVQRRNIPVDTRQVTILPVATSHRSSAAGENGVGFEDLTDREMDVLQYLGRRLQNKEIASRLQISPHTVGYHLKHIYNKLGVNSRRQAVLKAQALGILTPR